MLAPMPKTFVYDPPSGPLSIVYADADLVVIDKPSGLLTVPGKDERLKDSVEARIRVTQWRH